MYHELHQYIVFKKDIPNKFVFTVGGFNMKWEGRENLNVLLGMCIMSMYNSNSGAPSNQIVTTNTILIDFYSLANFQGQYGYNRENTHAHVLFNIHI